jgi:hypothetical protein
MIPGSVKNKVTASDLQEERAKCNFNRDEFTEIIHGGAQLDKIRRDWAKVFDDHPRLASSSEF